jgi:phosphomannomutase
MAENELLVTARAWLDAEPDDDIRIELDELIASAEAGDDVELADRFAGRLQFGTAGLRAAVAAGPMRMNRLVVRQAAAGIGQWLLDSVPDAADRGVVIARDARRKSDVFAVDTARVLAAMGIKAMLHPGLTPTPVLAWSITGLKAAAGVVVTASHNPPADNGYKVFLDTGSQIVNPIDNEIAARIDRFDPLTVELAAEDHPLIRWLDTSWDEAYLADIPAVRLHPEVPGVPIAYTAMHGVGGEMIAAAFTVAGFDVPLVVAEQQEPDGTFPTISFPNPEEPGALDLLLAVAELNGVAVALANDPDADRLGAAIPDTRAGSSAGEHTWRKLSGDEIGWLFADHILRHTEGDDRLVVTTLVSSSLLARMAEAHGVHSAETFTGFKLPPPMASRSKTGSTPSQRSTAVTKPPSCRYGCRRPMVLPGCAGSKQSHRQQWVEWRWNQSRRTPKQTSYASCWTAARGSRSGRVELSRKSSSTVKRSTSTLLNSIVCCTPSLWSNHALPGQRDRGPTEIGWVRLAHRTGGRLRRLTRERCRRCHSDVRR